MNQFWSPIVERCGFILKDGSVVELENTHPQRSHAFSISDSDFEKYEGRIATVWHTHPDSNVNLSVADYRAFLTKPEVLHMIIGEQHTALFYVEDQTVLIRSHSHGNS